MVTLLSLPFFRVFAGSQIACGASAFRYSIIIKSLDSNQFVLQVSRGKVAPQPFSTDSVTPDVYRCKDSLKEGLEKADLVISQQVQEAIWRLWEGEGSPCVVIHASPGTAISWDWQPLGRGAPVLLDLPQAWAFQSMDLSTQSFSSWPARTLA